MRTLLQLFLFLVVLLGLPDWYIYRNYVRRVRNKWLRLSYPLPSLALFAAAIAVFATFEPKPEAMNRLTLLLILILCMGVPKAAFALTAPLLRGVERKTGHRLFGTGWALLLSLFVMGCLVFGVTEGKQHFQVREVTISSESLPKGFEGYRIVQLSDIHAGSWTGNAAALQKAVEQVNALHPDLILFTGDLVNNLAGELDEFMPVLSRLKAKDGVYSVLGNHDYSLYIRWENKDDQRANLDSLKAKEARMGWQMLNNRHAKIYHNGDSIALIGVENSGNPPFPDYADLKGAMAGTEGMFRILMSHDPTHWRREVLPHTDIPLTLSGHTHAMQTRLLGFSPSRFVYPEHDGLYTEGDQHLYVNIGLGYLIFPMRMGAWPEITLITLKQ